jgi:hypothetical protein
LFKATGILKGDTTKTSYTVEFSQKGLTGDKPFIEAITRLSRKLEALGEKPIVGYGNDVKDYTTDANIVCVMIQNLCDEVEWTGITPELPYVEGVEY